jgi:phosphoglycolate phosphatase
MTQEQNRFASVRVLIFDLDGTLIDSKTDLVRSVNATLKHFGREPLDAELISSYVGKGAPLLVRRALGNGFSEAQFAEGLKYFLSYYREHMLDNTLPYMGVQEALDLLQNRSLAVLTNKPVRFSREILKGLGLLKYFRYVHGGNSFERKKPDPVGVEAILNDFAAGARETMMVGDSEVDIQTARNAGTWACGVTYGFGNVRSAESIPDLLVGNLRDLPAHLDGKSAID